MVKVSTGEDCGNAPKKAFVLDFLIANASGDTEKALSMVADDVRIELVGREVHEGKSAFAEILRRDDAAIDELEVHNILSHGDRCAANGVWYFADGGTVAFNSMYRFNGHGKNAVLRQIDTYSIVMEKTPTGRAAS